MLVQQLRKCCNHPVRQGELKRTSMQLAWSGVCVNAQTLADPHPRVRCHDVQYLFPGAEPDFDGVSTGERMGSKRGCAGCVGVRETLRCTFGSSADVLHTLFLADEGIVQASGKMEVLDRLLRKLKRRGHRVVLFSQVGWW